jgi:glycosyltransferase involved in cell wall biosynthesis
MMHILHVITTINRGGAENHLVALVSEQVASGLRVTVAYLKGDGYWQVSLRDMGVRVEPLGLGSYGEISPMMKLRALIRSVAPDVVHAHMPPAELYTRLALLFLHPAPVIVISKHNDEPFFRGVGQAAMGRWVSRRATRMIAISDAVNAYARNHLNMPADRVTTVHYGVEPRPYEQVSESLRQDLRAEWGIPPDAWVIGTVARLVPQKTLHVLLNAYAQYRVQARQVSRLVLVGRGPLEAELKALSGQLGLENEIIWAGFREDIPAVMNALDAFVLTSSYEGFGLVLLEAMAAARPVVASRVSAIPEIVQDGMTGLLCESGDPEDFAHALLSLEEADVRTRLGTAGHDRVLIHFTPARMAEATFSVYKECLA